MTRPLIAYFYVVVPYYTDLTNPDSSRVLRIRNNNEFDEFVFTYAGVYNLMGGHRAVMVNWSIVEKDFGGIEIIPLLEDRERIQWQLPNKYTEKGIKILRKNKENIYDKYKENGIDLNGVNLFFYQTWDVASGCIWNPKAIKKFYIISKKKGELDLKKINLKDLAD